MMGRFCKSDDRKPTKDNPPAPAPAPQTPLDDDEEDGDIATPKRDRDDEAG
jgi:hypothetical protein